MRWQLTNNNLNQQTLLNSESLFSLANGYLGVRSNFEEGYTEGMMSIRGTYLNAFHDNIEILYGERLYGFPKTQQKLLNINDSQSIQLFFGEDEEPFSLFSGEILSYERNLHLDQGYSERIIHWRSPKGKELKLHFRRLVSFAIKELFAIDIRIEPVNFSGLVKVISSINGDIANYIDETDPRVGSKHAKLLSVEQVDVKDNCIYVLQKTNSSGLLSACAAQHLISTENQHIKIEKNNNNIQAVITFNLTETIHLTKLNVYTDTLRHQEELLAKAIDIQYKVAELTFTDLLKQQKEYLDDFWQSADIQIAGDTSLQEAIRFNLYHLLQSAGRDQFSHISAKGLSGEGYEGHYFWDTEIYMLPVFILTRPELAEQLLIYRYSTLEQAKERAKEMGHKKGALYPWRTISGTECSSFFPAGTAQYHISADVAYSFVQYYLATNNFIFIKKYGAEVLFETARLWMELGHYRDGEFRIDGITGPDEYTCIVNNNYYTNIMAKYNLSWSVKIFQMLKEEDYSGFLELCSRLQLPEEEVWEWQNAADQLYLPYNQELEINPQDDSFLQKAVWDFANTPKDNYPLLLHYHPLTLYRYQVCKQADTVLAHFLVEDEEDLATIRNSFDYYEKVTTHDSSLSACIFSIMAAKVGYLQKSYDYFIETARLDLDNTHGNTKDGLHLANMGGTWLSIVYGFAGLRLKEEGLSLAPIIPKEWDSYAFHVKYRDCQISLTIDKERINLVLSKGESLTIKLYGEELILSEGLIIERELQFKPLSASEV